jgi:glutamine synthetase
MVLTLEEFNEMCEVHGVHTVEIATPDTYGHLRGKRVPVDRFFATTHKSACGMADAIFVMDIQNDLPDNEFINMDSGFLDCHLYADVSTGRILTHRPGYAMVFADVFDSHGNPHPLSPRAILKSQIRTCTDMGLDPVVATELEFYLCNPDWSRVQDHIQYSSLTDALELEDVLAAMRAGLIGAGMDVESSNAEYGPGQIEINVTYNDALRTADDTVLFRSIIKQVAVQYGLRATFMPKPWMDQGGSGMHVHTSLKSSEGNVFASSDGAPNTTMSKWLAGILKHAPALGLLGAPTANGPRRIDPYTFAPTHIHWGLDNRTVLARCIAEAGSAANRVEFRAAGADANPYLVIAGLLAAGADGITNDLDPGPMSEGDMYTNPGDCVALANTLDGVIQAFTGSELSTGLGEMFSASFVSMAVAEAIQAAENAVADDVNDWERDRYIEFS